MKRVWARARPSGARDDNAFPFALHLDDDDERCEHSVLVRGWIAVPPEVRSIGLFLDCGPRLPIARYPRPDGEALFPHQQIVGFEQLVALTSQARCDDWSLELLADGKSYRAALDIAGPPMAAARQAFREKKQRSLDRILPILRCPQPDVVGAASRSCGGVVEATGGSLQCRRCSTRFGASDLHFDFLTPELTREAAVVETENVSSWQYDTWASELIERYSDGLILDNGSGLKRHYHENVVHLDIVDYASTDVLAIGERLPFADASFDAVFSLAVLEHVRDPFRCAVEIVRVLKPGGTLYAHVPFLQAYHGYPHHYYNMTLQGLENLFSGRLEIERSGTPVYGWPIFTLTDFLSRYRDGLAPEAARRFERMRVKDFLLAPGELATKFLEESFVTKLSEKTRTEIASVNYVVATKPVR